MRDFSLETVGKKITSKSTEEYFKEVISSYYNKNYRAAIVTLYSVVICDLLAKLETLEDIFDDEIAESILEKVKDFQTKNPQRSDWENTLVEDIKGRTNLLDNVDYAHINSLRQLRHLCAHPVLNKENKLYTPNHETVGSHVRNMLESVLTKPAILSKKILKTILLDVANKKDILMDKINLHRYLNSKYLQNLTRSTEIDIFRELWKIVFRLNNDNSNDNRKINYRVLCYLYERNSQGCNEKISGDKQYFSKIGDGLLMSFLIDFLAERDFLYSEMTDEVHLKVEKRIEESLEAKTVAWFLSTNFEEHLLKVKTNESEYSVSSSPILRLLKIGKTKGYLLEIIEYSIWKYSSSANYNDADNGFSYVLSPFLDDFSLEQLHDLCKNIEKNSQAYGRRRARDDHNQLLKICLDKSDNDFKIDLYPKTFEGQKAEEEMSVGV